MESENRRSALGGLAALLLVPLAMGRNVLSWLPGTLEKGSGTSDPTRAPRVQAPDHSVMRRG